MSFATLQHTHQSSSHINQPVKQNVERRRCWATLHMFCMCLVYFSQCLCVVFLVLSHSHSVHRSSSLAWHSVRCSSLKFSPTSLSLHHSLSVCLSLSPSLSLSLLPHSLSVCLSLSHSLSVCLSLSITHCRFGPH